MSEIEKNNKLFADFLNWKKNDDGYITPFYQYYRAVDTRMYQTSTFRDLLFHKDWNWLIEVVEKIETLGADLTIRAEHTTIVYDEGEQISTYAFKSKIETVYNACVEFIKWYNNQNK